MAFIGVGVESQDALARTLAELAELSGLAIGYEFMASPGMHPIAARGTAEH